MKTPWACVVCRGRQARTPSGWRSSLGGGWPQNNDENHCETTKTAAESTSSWHEKNGTKNVDFSHFPVEMAQEEGKRTKGRGDENFLCSGLTFD